MSNLSERIAESVLVASGSSLRHFSVNGRRKEIIAAAGVADDLVAALNGVLNILGTAESNASGNPEWDYVGPRVAAARAALAKAGVA